MSKLKNVDQKQLNSDYEWIQMQNVSKYKGQWIAIFAKEIIARDTLLKNVKDSVTSLSLSNIPLYIRVPEGSITT